MSETEPRAPRPQLLRGSGRVAGDRPARDPWVGRRIGPTKLRQLIAAGRNGRVYLAEWFDGRGQERLAVRLLGLGSDRRHLLQRLAALREALAPLVHPNVPRLLAAGLTRSGQIYWATPYVDGMRIDRYCNEQRLELEARLHLFVAVCDAVQQAHERSIAHGALGPENILVDAGAQPQVLDFGMALLLGLGTDSAASLEVSTDIRALGILLDELLRGAVGTGARDTAALDAIVRRATHESPEQRFASVQELALAVRARWSAALAPTQAGRVLAPGETPAAVSPISPASSLPRAAASASARRRPAAHRGMLLAGPAVVVVAAAALVSLGRPRATGDTARARGTAMESYRQRMTAAEAAIRDDRVETARGLLEDAGQGAPTTTEMRGWESTHLSSRLDRSLVSVRAHESSITAVAFGVQDRIVATGAEDGTIRLWDSANGALLRSLGPVPRPPRFLAVQPTQEMVAVGCDSGLVIVLDRDNQVRGRFEDARSQDPLARRGAVQANSADMPGRAPTVEFDVAGTRLVARLWSGDAVLWEVQSFRRLARRRRQQVNDATLLAWTGRPPVSPTASGAIVLRIADHGSAACLESRDRASGRVRATFRGHTAGIRAVAASADGRLVASGDGSGTLKIWDARTQDVRTFLVAASTPAHAWAADIGTSADGSWIFSTAADFTGAVEIWNVPQDAHEVVPITGATAVCLDVGPGGEFALVGQADGGVARLDVAAREVRWRVRGHSGRVRAVDIAPSGRGFVTGGDDALVVVWDLETRAVLRRLRGHAGAVLDVAYAPDGAAIVSSAQDGTLRLWDARTGKLKRVLHGHAGPVHAVAFTPDGHGLVSASADGTVRLWDVGRDRARATLLQRPQALLAVGYAADGSRLAAAGAEGIVHVLDARHHCEVAQLHGHSGPIVALVFAPGDASLVTTSHDGTIRLWDAGRGIAGLEPPPPNHRAATATGT